MKKSLFLVLAVFMIVPCLVTAQEYTIDPGHSTVLMKVQRFGVVNVIGRFGDISGTIVYTTEDIAATSININVATDSYTANNIGGENSAMGPAFLDAANFPTLSFEATNVEVAKNGYLITGNLTVHGVTKEIQFEGNIIGPLMDLPTQKQSIALSGTIFIDRLDYGVGPNRTLPDGREIIGNRVEIHLEILAIASH
jgi:polyisoprenoid-binding protein YceI